MWSSDAGAGPAPLAWGDGIAVPVLSGLLACTYQGVVSLIVRRRARGKSEQDDARLRAARRRDHNGMVTTEDVRAGIGTIGDFRSGYVWPTEPEPSGQSTGGEAVRPSK